MTEQYQDWRGTAAELAALGVGLLETFGLSEEKLNERLVRYYVAEGVLSRPERQGREAWFAYRQLLELLVARLLSRDGWPLAKIATWNRAADDQALRDLIPERQADPGDPQGLLVAEGIAEYLSERLADVQQCPPHRIERQVLIQVPGAFSLLMAEADFRAMTPAKADHYAKLLRDLLRALPRDPASPNAR